MVGPFSIRRVLELPPARSVSTSTEVAVSTPPARGSTSAVRAVTKGIHRSPAIGCDGGNQQTLPSRQRQTNSAPSRLPPGVTPLIAPRWARLLQGHPDLDFQTYVVHGISHGFSIGFTGQFLPKSTPNLSSAVAQADFVSAHLRDCTNRSETAGPFSSPPLLNFVASPLGTVPKKPDKLRLIHHLSAPEGLSVNDGITKEDFSLQYVKVDDAIARIMQLGRGTLLAKFDIRRAFRLCPVRPEDWHLLGMCWEGKYYYDKVLPFGLRSAPFIFNEVAEAFQWICAHHLSIEDMLHLLDDFLVLGPPKSVLCEQRITLALQMCYYLGIPIADEKTTWPSTELIFLGIILDTDKFESRLPDDKREDLLRLLEDMIERKHCTLKELEHLLGKLQFASRVVIPGRTFLRRLYDAAGHATQSFHRVRLSTACRLDLRWWKHFLQSWNGRSFFLEPWYTLASDLQVQTDAAASVGFGAICGGEWFTGCWSDLQSRCCITYMELYPIALACSTWGHKWTAKRIEFLTDNQAVAACITSGTCRCGNVMSLLRALFFVCAKNNCQITATYFPGSTNTIADALSRQEWDRFRQLAPQARESPTAITSLPCIPGETSLQPCASMPSKH